MGDAGFARGRFSRDHEWSFDGGLVIPASASPGVIPAPYADATALDPEEAFVAALASCHMMSFLYLANRRGIGICSYDDDAFGVLGMTASGRKAITQVTLQPRVGYSQSPPLDVHTERELHDTAHELCFIANSVSSEIVIAPRQRA